MAGQALFGLAAIAVKIAGMHHPFVRPLGVIALSVCCAAGAARADSDGVVGGPGILTAAWQRITDRDAWNGPGHWRLLASPYTQHYHYSVDHRPVWAVGAEWQSDDLWLAGVSYFSNSFGQPSAYAFVGHRSENLFGDPRVFFQWSAGPMYGYVGKYKSKVPLDVMGFSPGAVLTLGWKVDRNVSFAVHALGDAGLMFQLSYDLH